ncbi:acyltransferase [Pelomonas sp. KK5]|uniref:LpxL/LpxP family acyltransferase n=1 Tax=Pelomonas sp. KK5 TaxID=1855730 RepID=UPI00097C105D|nr:acyltransferase [Pelomonas sp. KK5]
MSRSRHWAAMGESTFVGGIWALYWVHRLTGRRLFRLCLAPVVLVHWLARPALRAASLQYLRRLHAAHAVFGSAPGWRHGLRHVALFAETMLDKLLAMADRYPKERVRFHNREPMLAAIAAGRGGILVTAHIGCLELCRAMAEVRAGLKINVLVHTRHAQAFNAMLQRLNPQASVHLIEVSEIGAPTAMLLAGKVEAGEFVAIAGDRVPVHRSKTVSVDFLGHAAPLPVGAYVLAALLKCPLFLLGCVHEAGGYAIHFDLLADRVTLPRADREGALRAHAQQFADALTALLRRSPYDWFNFFPFWDQAHDQ